MNMTKLTNDYSVKVKVSDHFYISSTPTINPGAVEIYRYFKSHLKDYEIISDVKLSTCPNIYKDAYVFRSGFGYKYAIELDDLSKISDSPGYLRSVMDYIANIFHEKSYEDVHKSFNTNLVKEGHRLYSQHQRMVSNSEQYVKTPSDSCCSDSIKEPEGLKKLKKEVEDWLKPSHNEIKQFIGYEGFT